MAGRSDVGDSSCWDASGVSFKALAGVTYRFQVGGFDAESGEHGELPFSVERVTPETNDDLANAIVIGSFPYADPVNLRKTSRQPSEPSICFLEMGNSAWYKWTPAANDGMRASAEGSPEFTPGVAVYTSTGPGFGSLTLVNCAEDGPADFFAQSGMTYVFQVATNRAMTMPSAFQLELDPTP